MHITCESAPASSFLSFIIILFLCLIMAHKLASTFTFSSASFYCWFLKVTTISWLAGWFVSLVNRFWPKEATEEDTRATKTVYKLLNPGTSELASTSSSASFHSNYSCDVFISHCGKDVKKTIASHLYRNLSRYRLKVFLDQPELQRGEYFETQIKRAIRSASVHVAIFSPGYAESKWCLDELVLMLKSGTPIIPVFYKVKPSELRWTDKGKDGVYAQALLTHEKKRRYDQERLAAWRKALSDVSSITGFELESYNDDEGQLVDKVQQEVQKRVRKPPLEVATYPTGLDEKLQDLERTVLLEQRRHKRGPSLVGIVGITGVGKTTLAKGFFNRNSSKYDRSCFLSEVSDAAAKSSLPSLQTQLYEDLNGKFYPPISSINEGIGMLRDRLSCPSKVLIVVDDVDDVKQRDALFSPLKNVLSSDSLIIMISLDKDFLKKLGIKGSSIYTLTELGPKHSKELFCWHAFHQPNPAVGYQELVTKFLNECQGLPLSLEVMGTLLHSESPEIWESQLRKLYQVLPTKIQCRLKIRSHNLDNLEKEILFDTACFFIGIKKDTAIRIWNASGWEGSLCLRTLESKCLVTVDSENCIRMHSHLQYLGRDLAEKELPGCPRRLSCPTQDSLPNVPTQSTVRGISMVQKRSGESFQTSVQYINRITGLSGLQLLRAPGDCLESIFKVMRQPDLIWLRCDSFSDSSIPSCVPINNLRVLELGDPHDSGSKLETLWPDSEQQAPFLLTELRIGVLLLRIPKSIGQLAWLEKIELHKFEGTLPKEFFHLSSLKHLLLRANMTSLPACMKNLRNLEHIDLSCCYYLQTLPLSFGQLINLQVVNLTNCVRLKMLPVSFRNLIRLKYLSLWRCRELTVYMRIPRSICRGLLELELELHSLPKLKPRSWAKLPSLRELELQELQSLRELELEELRELALQELQSLRESLRELELEELELQILRELELGEREELEREELELELELEELEFAGAGAGAGRAAEFARAGAGRAGAARAAEFARAEAARPAEFAEFDRAARVAKAAEF